MAENGINAPQLSKYFSGRTETLMRSQIKAADYNPRQVHPDTLKTLKKGIRKFGIVGGLVVNGRTGNTIIGGHQRIAVADQLHGWPENDYPVKVELVDLSEKEEKELNILLNNPNAQGQWDYDKLRELMPEIDYKAAGLTEVDLSMIGCEYMFETDATVDMIRELEDVNGFASVGRTPKKETPADFFNDESDGQIDAPPAVRREMTDQEKKDHMKDVKKAVKEQAIERVGNLTAYLTLSFDNLQNKTEFCERFDINPGLNVIKGEVFAGLFEDDE